MSIKPKFVSNETPGFAEIRIPDYTATGDQVEIAIKRSGDGSYLGDSGWLTNENWLSVNIQDDNGECVIPIGPSQVDPLASCLSSFMFQLFLKDGGATVAGVIKKTSVTLLSSQAGGAGMTSTVGSIAAGTTTPAPEPEPVEEPACVEEPVSIPEPEPQPEPQPSPTVEAPAESSSKKGLFIALAVIALLLVGGAIAFYSGLFDSKTEDPATATPATPTPEVSSTQTPAQSLPPAAPTAPTLTTRQIVQDFLATNPDAPALLAKAEEMKAEGRLDGAMLLYRQAAGKGDAKAALLLARMYDPKYFSKETSPLPNADAETAAYWYEGPAKNGDVEAQRELGRVLIEQNPSGFQKEKAVEWLTKAAEGGDAEAQSLLSQYQ
ncbi:tetratricopeptide repeat protein [Terasakiella pusilla]|uniref:tetratricopeptide repeat protein n=1 Tax=Terasakiella pusilla TaxID=64973 RepID=UPI00048E542D|nr:sel1 repeat family protein [Terasakiella pusilla]